MEFKRNCPNCNKEIIYMSEKGREQANIKNSLCQSCRNKEIHNMRVNSKYKKKCELCDKEIFYINEKQLEIAINNKSICLSCSAKLRRKEKNFYRKCPNCNKLIGYISEFGLKQAEKNNLYVKVALVKKWQKIIILN